MRGRPKFLPMNAQKGSKWPKSDFENSGGPKWLERDVRIRDPEIIQGGVLGSGGTSLKAIDAKVIEVT